MNIDSYPKVYRPTPTNRVLLAGLALLLILPVFAVLGDFIKDSFTYVIIAVLAGLGMFLMIGVWKDKTTLYRDSIIQTGIFSSKELRRHDIRAYRRRSTKGAPLLDLLPADPRLKTITVTRIALEDPAFITWLRGFEDMNAADTETFDKALMQDATLSGALEERKAQVKKTLRIPIYLTYGYVVALSLAMFYHRLAWLLPLVPIIGPWIAIAMTWARGRDFTILGTGKSLLRKGTLFQLFILPVFYIYVVFSTTLDGGHGLPLNWQRLLVPSLIGALLMAAIVWVISRAEEIDYSTLLKIFVLLIVYCGGSLALINSVFDHGGARMFSLTVNGKHRTGGKGASDYLEVSSTDPAYDGETSIRTPPDVYRAVAIHGPVCAAIHPGALGMPWESVSICDIRPATVVERTVEPPASIAVEPDPLAIQMGDDLETVRRILKTDADLIPMRRNPALPSNVPDMTAGHSLLRLPDKGIWVFFDQRGAVYCIRLDKPFSGEIKGIALGDDLTKLTVTLGSPRTAPRSAFGDMSNYRYPLDDARHVAFDLNAQGVQIMFITH